MIRTPLLISLSVLLFSGMAPLWALPPGHPAVPAPARQPAATAVPGPLSGVYAIEGMSHNGQKWNGTLKLVRKKGSKYTGFFTWKTGETPQSEDITGFFTKKTGILTLKAVVKPGITQPATYTATVSADGRVLSLGNWTGTPDSPGIWAGQLQQ